MPNLRPQELLIILVIVLVLFGGSKLPQLARNLDIGSLKADYQQKYTRKTKMEFEHRISISAVIAVATLFMLIATSHAEQPENPHDGQIYQSTSGPQVWHARSGTWVGPETFWLDYASENQGRFWGRGSNYPPYREVSEHDTILIEVEAGPCLMYFFHRRWRRAQDVRRWDPAFNDIGGCPRVFQ